MICGESGEGFGLQMALRPNRGLTLCVIEPFFQPLCVVCVFVCVCLCLCVCIGDDFKCMQA